MYVEIQYINKRNRTLIEGNLQLRKSLKDIGRNSKLEQLNNLILRPNKYGK